MTQRRWNPVFVMCAVVLLLYGAGYGTLRWNHSLVRTGKFLNARGPGGVLTPDAGWMENEIGRPAASPGGEWLEVVFFPAIFVERTWWGTLGRQANPI